MKSTAPAASAPAKVPTGAALPSEAARAALTDLISRGRSRGQLSLSELRTAFIAAGVSAGDGRSILRELTDHGVRLANRDEDSAPVAETDAEDDVLEDTLIATAPDTDEAPKTAKVSARKGPAPRRKARTTRRAKKTEPTVESLDQETGEADLDDHSPAMGDSVHTYLKAIGRRQLLTAEQEVDLAKRVEAGLYAEYRLGLHGEVDGTVEMAPAEREELEEIAEDGRKAKSHMLEANLRLVVSVAKKYSDRGMSLLDVVQEGNLGLIRAVEKFDYSKGFKFSTYAMWWIRQAIQRGFADSARTIRLPVHVLELLSKVSRLERDMHQALGREPTPEELALELDKTPAQIEELLRVTRQPISLDSTIGEDGETRIGDLIEDVDASEASEVVDRQLMADQLRNALSDLEPREATIMSLRFGLMDGRPRTLDEIGKHLGLTRERIRQLEKQSLSKLRHPSRAQQLLDFAS
ncbi:sigma-70 family RNA polymerase sigma factor [Nocardiopsis algeriensis]|uniref:RNA polymerase sigma factor n=1 Tax=Nocardiopsis algeriensis TaxID=1478215 RepID=A0A841IMU8_9ACTN|nr:sigma-70 family RNA polymerase sigma factor [Nocardiopsis algeriensis]MBB6120139.1 RNA polymerase primary sigma factor [Nocardiopsis algeriensis]